MNDHTITQEEIDMANENIRLEKENAALRQELEAVKVERDEALHCMMVYANEGDEDFESLKEAEAKLFALQTACDSFVVAVDSKRPDVIAINRNKLVKLLNEYFPKTAKAEEGE